MSDDGPISEPVAQSEAGAVAQPASEPSADSAADTEGPPGTIAIGIGFGMALALARRHAGLTVEELAARLRLHPRQVEAIEAENLGALPSAPYVSGFVRNFAREVRLDAAPLIDDLHEKLVRHGGPSATLDLRGTEGPRRPMLDERRWRQLVLSGIVLVLVCGGLIGLWIAHQRGSLAHPAPAPVASGQAAFAPGAGGSGAADTVAQGSAAPPEAPIRPAVDTGAASPARDGAFAAPAQPAAVGVGPSNPGAAAAPTPALANAAAPASIPSPAPMSSAKRPPSPPAASPLAPPAGQRSAPAANGLVLRFNDRSWVEVSEPTGRVLLSRTGEPGSLEMLNAAVPLQLVVGRADAVVVEYRGQAVDLKPFVSGNGVARVTLADGRASSGGQSIR
jgi:cytoskeleton protein RodZ